MSHLPAPRPGAGPLWIGARVPSSSLFAEPEPFRCDVALWMDAASKRILAYEMVPPTAPASVLVGCLYAALVANVQSWPARLRLLGDTVAEDVRKLLPDVELEVTQILALGAIGLALCAHLGRRRRAAPGPLQAEGLAAADLGEFCTHMSALWQAAPWDYFVDGELLDLDIPALDVFGACLSVSGARGVTRGVLVFDSWEDFDRFLSRAAEAPADPHEPWEPGVRSLGLLFSRREDLPESMRRNLAPPDARSARGAPFPWLIAFDARGGVRPATVRELHLGCAAAAAVTALVHEHADELCEACVETCVDGIRSWAILDAPVPLEARIKFMCPVAAEEEPESACPVAAEDEPEPEPARTPTSGAEPQGALLPERPATTPVWQPSAGARRWIAFDDEPLPPPQSPCPCGSGYAFFTCCAPR